VTVADALGEVVLPVGKAVQMEVEVLKEAAGVVLAFHGQPDAAPYTRVDAIGGHQVLAADEFLLVAAIAVDNTRGHTARLLRQVLERRVVFDVAAEPRP